MITQSPRTRRLTTRGGLAYIGGHVHPLSSSNRHHFRHRVHGLQVCVFDCLYQQKEFVQTTRRGCVERDQSARHDRCARKPDSGWFAACDGQRSKRDSGHPRVGRPCRSCGTGCGSDSGAVVRSAIQAASRNLCSPREFSCGRHFLL